MTLVPTHTTHTLSERAMKSAEQRIPELAAKSGREAYKASLSKTGGAVVKTGQGKIVERRADGTSKVIKQVPLGKRVKSGTVITRAK